MSALSAASVSVRAAAPVATVAQKSMKVWTPFNNKFFETMSFLPPLSEKEVAAQIDYLTRSKSTPCIEFASPEQSIVSNENTVRMGPVTPNYYDNRYWTMWKLPMFGCTDSSQVAAEIQACIKAFPGAYIRVAGFDASRQVQVAGFLVHRPVPAISTAERSV